MFPYIYPCNAINMSILSAMSSMIVNLLCTVKFRSRIRHASFKAIVINELSVSKKVPPKGSNFNQILRSIETPLCPYPLNQLILYIRRRRRRLYRGAAARTRTGSSSPKRHSSFKSSILSVANFQRIASSRNAPNPPSGFQSGPETF